MSKLGRRIPIGVLWGSFALLTACSGQSLTGPSEPHQPTPRSEPTYGIQVVTVTIGMPTDPDGYQLTLDGKSVGTIGCMDSRTFDGLTGDLHEVVLSGVAANCEVQGGDERVVSIQGDKGWVGFQVVCSGVDRLLRQIAFTSMPKAMSEAIWVMDADGTDAAQLSPPYQRSDYAAVSPDGSMIAYASTGEDPTNRWGLHVMSADGSGVERLTTFSDDVPGSWSPDGRRIAFSSGRHGGADAKAMQAPGQWRGNTEIYAIGVDGGGEIRLTDDPGQDLGPAWSPDGASIVFETDREGHFELYLLRLSDGKLQNLTARAGYDGEAAWSPDGSRIAFTTERDGNREIYVMERDGTDVRRLTTHPAADEQPAWSPDGRSVLFTSDRDGTSQIYSVRLDGGSPVQLTDGGVESFHGSWSP